MVQTLPVTRLVNVGIELTPVQAAFPNLSTMLILGTSDVIDTTTRIREYATLTEVAVDFGTTDEEYLASQIWFAASPKPDSILIGRWVNAASAGQLYCGRVPTGDSVVGPWNAVNNGSFNCSVDGVPEAISNLDFSGALNMNGVASVIESGFPGGVATVVWDATNSRFVITSASTGVASSVSFLTAGVIGTDISTMMSGLSTSVGAYLAPGLDAQTALDTVILFDDNFSSQWYGLEMPSASAADFAAVAAYIEAGDIAPHFFGQTSQDPEDLNPLSTTDVMYLAKQAAYTKSAIQYSSTSLYAIASFLAKILTTNWGGSNTTITLMFKDEPLVVSENLSTTQANAIDAKNGNVYAAYNNGQSIIQSGITPSGQYVDTVIGCDWLRGAIQSTCFNLLRAQPKIPQTDAGMHQLGTAIESVLSQAVRNGLLAPGIWTGPSFGQLTTGDTLSKGYYVFVPPLSSQSTTDRAARRSVSIRVAVKLAGAVQHVDVLVDVNP